MENRRNYYRILHVQHDAPGEIINTSYRTLMQRLKMHPDLGGNHWQASLINEAYSILSDPERRAIYDGAMNAAKNEDQGAGSNARQQPPSDKSFDDEAPAPGHCFYCQTPHPAIEVTNEDDCVQCFSPLTMPDNAPTVDSARRTIDRMPKSFPLQFCSESQESKTEKGLVVDLSPGGMRFIADTSVDVGSVVAIDSELCTAIGKVRRCASDRTNRQYHNDIAVQFLALRFKTKQGVFVSVRA